MSFYDIKVGDELAVRTWAPNADTRQYAYTYLTCAKATRSFIQLSDGTKWRRDGMALGEHKLRYGHPHLLTASCARRGEAEEIKEAAEKRKYAHSRTIMEGVIHLGTGDRKCRLAVVLALRAAADAMAAIDWPAIDWPDPSEELTP